MSTGSTRGPSEIEQADAEPASGPAPAVDAGAGQDAAAWSEAGAGPTSMTDSGVASVDREALPDADLAQATPQELSLSVCPPGTYLVGETDGSTRCGVCAFGTYSTSVNAETCVAWRDCGWARTLGEGTNSSDVQCEVGGRFRQFGSPGDDLVSSLVIGAGGDVYVAGINTESFPGFANFSLESYYIAKFGPTGELERVTYVQAPRFRSAVEVPDYMHLVAQAHGLTAVRMGVGAEDVWADVPVPIDIVLNDIDGNARLTTETRIALDLPWLADEDGTSQGRFHLDAVAAGPAGDTLLAGTNREDTFVTSCGVGYVFRVRPGVGEVWRRTVEPTDTCLSVSSVRTRGDVIYLAGHAHGEARSEGFVAGFALDGSELWKVTIDAQSREVSDMVVGEDGGLFVAFATPVDVNVEKWTHEGARVWSKTLVGAYFAPHLALDATGDLWVTGGTDLVLTATGYDGRSAHHGSLDAYVAKMSPDGETLWLSQFGSDSRDAGVRLAIGAGLVYLAGETNGTLGNQVGERDGFLVQLTGTNEPDLEL